MSSQLLVFIGRALTGLFFIAGAGCVVWHAQRSAQPLTEDSTPDEVQPSIESDETGPDTNADHPVVPVMLPSSKVGPLHFDPPPLTPPAALEELLDSSKPEAPPDAQSDPQGPPSPAEDDPDTEDPVETPQPEVESSQSSGEGASP